MRVKSCAARQITILNEGETDMKFIRSTSILVIAGMIIALTIAASGQSPERRIAKRVMEGSWKVTVTPGPSPVPLPPSIESIATYTEGGGLIETDNLAVPGSFATTGQGAWEATASREFNITFTKYQFTTQGLFQGSVRITESIIRDSSDNEYTGEGRIEVINPAGTTILVIPATSRATRISAEAP
jgi:hypothetical protein